MSSWEWAGMMPPAWMQAGSTHLAQLEEMLARAATLGVSESRARAIIAAESVRAKTSPQPFSWDRVKGEIDKEGGIALG